MFSVRIRKYLAMKSAKIFTFLFCLSISKSDAFNYPLIKDYLRWKNLKVVLLVTCESEMAFSFHVNETINYFQSNDIWINYYDISYEKDPFDFNYDHFFLRWSYQYLVVVNLECNYTTNILNKISKRKMFHFERSWLIFARNTKQIFNVLNKENINVDADIATAVSVGENFMSVLIPYRWSKRLILYTFSGNTKLVTYTIQVMRERENLKWKM